MLGVKDMIIDGNAIAKKIQQEIKSQISAHTGRPPCLAMILVGEHPPSLIYVNRKIQACAAIGCLSIRLQLPADISEKELITEIKKLNTNTTVDGILLQLPLPAHLNPLNIIQCISPDKDVDGLHPINVGKLLIGDPQGFVPCTPLGIKVMLERSSINVSGKHVVMVGRSNLVGKPIAALLMQHAEGANATVTVIHSKTQNPKEVCRLADILIVAIGKPRYLTADMVKEGAVIIDVGINKIEKSDNPQGYQIVGDVDFDAVKDKCSAISPVPGGVGPMTIAMLMSNTWKSFCARMKV
jgi:methylenetetrahydrofolate dehydrogenase (NADP+)/methenyltetrahydrofolate cyclohydrolase